MPVKPIKPIAGETNWDNFKMKHPEMSKYMDNLKIKFPEMAKRMAELKKYWQSIKGQTGMPIRGNTNPVTMPPAGTLPGVTRIAERINEMRSRKRARTL